MPEVEWFDMHVSKDEIASTYHVKVYTRNIIKTLSVHIKADSCLDAADIGLRMLRCKPKTISENGRPWWKVLLDRK